MRDNIAAFNAVALTYGNIAHRPDIFARHHIGPRNNKTIATQKEELPKKDIKGPKSDKHKQANINPTSKIALFGDGSRINRVDGR